MSKIEKDRRNGYSFTIHTDASYNHITGNGAGAYIIIDNYQEVMKTQVVEYRNAKGSTHVEFDTIINAINDIPAMASKDIKVKLFTDSLSSMSMIQTYISANKKRGILKQIDINQEMILNSFDLKIAHEKGHNGNELNEMCDKLAVKARKEMDILAA